MTSWNVEENTSLLSISSIYILAWLVSLHIVNYTKHYFLYRNSRYKLNNTEIISTGVHSMKFVITLGNEHLSRYPLPQNLF